MTKIETNWIRRFGLLGSALLAAGACASHPDQVVESRQSAIGESGINLDLQVSGNSCWANGARTYLQVKNNASSAVKLSDITVKYWVNDTTGSPVVPHIFYGGCVTSSVGTCVHPVTNVSATASAFTACGPDAQHQANWEITVSTTDTTTVGSGFTWSNLQTGVDLASFAAFSPGSTTWYSPCGNSQPFHADTHYAVYVKGALFTDLGGTPPDCRAPAPTLLATATSADVVKLYWNAVPGSTGVYVDRSTNAGVSWSQMPLLPAGSTTLVDVSKTADTAYCYRVRTQPGSLAATSNVSCVVTPFGFEGEGTSRVLSSGGTATEPAYATASKGKILLADVGTSGYVELSVDVPPGRYQTKVTYATGPDRGLVQLSVEGTDVGPAFDAYSAAAGLAEIELGETDVSKATGTSKKLRFRVTGKNAASSGSRIAVDVFKLQTFGRRSEAETSTPTVSGGDSRTAVVDAAASSGKVDVAQLNATGDFSKYTFAVPLPGAYSLVVRYKTGPDRGRFQAKLDGVTTVGAAVDGFATSATSGYIVAELGAVQIASSGNHEVRFDVTGKNAASTSFGTSVDYIELRTARGKQQLAGHRSPEMGAAALVGPLPGATIINLAIALPVRNAQQLRTLASQVSNPASPNYQAFITPAQFIATYGPLTADYNALTAFVQSKGLTVVETHADRMLLNASARADVVEQALFVKLNTYQRQDGTTFFAPDREPAVDVTSPVLHIGGLDNFVRIKPVNGNAGSGTNGYFRGDDFEHAYSYCSFHLEGQGECVGILAQGGFNQTDINAYQQDIGIAPANFVPVEGTSSTETPDDEVTLDIEMAIAMAPRLDAVVVFPFRGNDSDVLYNTFSKIVNGEPRLCRQLSSSFDLAGMTPSFFQPLLDRMTMQGQSFFQASGDDGIRFFPKNEVWNLAGVTVVGGTDLTLDGNGGAYVSETGWSGSGGGQLDCASTPVYQKADGTCLPPFQEGSISGANGTSTTRRNIPDVAMVSSPGVQTYHTDNGVHGVQSALMGTSVSAPLWAGFMALINQQRLAAGQKSVGFANDLLYSLSRDPVLYPLVFNDQVSGNNGQSAAAGYDLVTGIGSPRCNLVYQLASPTPLVQIPSTTITVTGTVDLKLIDAAGTVTAKSFTINDQVHLGLATPFFMLVSVVDDTVPAGAVANLRLAPNNVDVLVENHGLFEGGTFSGGPRSPIVAGMSQTFETTRTETDFQAGLPYVRGSGHSMLTFTSSRP